MNKASIDINCDLGEVATIEECQQDALLMRYISSCNIACGGHAGNPKVIQETINNASQNGLKIGAHPGYEDKLNFGRVPLKIHFDELKTSLHKQIELVNNSLVPQQLSMHHIKLHGALYNAAESDCELAQKLADFFTSEYPQQKILCLLGGEFFLACQQRNMDVIAEGFMDRAYLTNGSLMPRGVSGAVFDSPQQCTTQALQLIAQGQIDSLCIHGDNPNSLGIIKQVHLTLQQQGISIK